MAPGPSPDDRNSIASSDDDLAVLGADLTRYDESAADVRQEHRFSLGARCALPG
ncbi:hypothetical protein [Gordonia sp. MP11Mi]|uniref:Uncharacterized protein n=1 Tax=Gordonia sp. MP11Mi TaxID=3022769 RepID=A0AA97GV60_9ACTN